MKSQETLPINKAASLGVALQPVVRVLPKQPERVETGPTRFGDDWPGLFIRGDDAAAFAMSLHMNLRLDSKDTITRMQMEQLLELLGSCIQGKAGEMLKHPNNSSAETR